MLIPSTVHASQLVRNGDFSERLTGWQASEKVAKATPDKGGSGGPGSVKLELKGARLRGEAAVFQKIPFKLRPGDQAVLSFSWKKKWTGGAPADQSAIVSIVQPDGRAVEVWADRTTSMRDSWTPASVDISSFITGEGAYTIRLSASFSNGGGAGAGNQVGFDDVALSVPRVSTRPRTTVLHPTGVKTLTGDKFAIGGVTEAEMGVSKVEIAIVRASDGLYWNGDHWVEGKYLVPAKILSRKSQKTASWAYLWQLPTSDGELYSLTVLATDKNGNKEWPISLPLTIDTVAPGGAIFINEASSFTNNRAISVANQIQGASEMRFSINAGKTWTKWRPFEPVRKLGLPAGDGNKVLTGEFRDEVGNVFKVSTSIVLDTTPPVTKMTFPSPDGKYVKSATTIGAVFYEEMNGSTFKNDGTEAGSTFYVKQGSVWVPGSVVYDNGSKTAKFVPSAPLAEGTTYTAYLTDVRDAAGNRLAADYSWSFTTSGTAKLSLSAKITESVGGKLADGSGTVELTIPSGAVRSDTQVTLAEVKEVEAPSLAGFTRVSGIYKLGPDDLALGKKALLRIKYQPVEGIDKSSVQLFAYDQEKQEWVGLATRLAMTVDTAGSEIDLPTFYVAAIRTDSSLPTSTILSPTGLSVLSGKKVLVSGVSHDASAVSKVEVAVVRLKDGYYLNGDSWSPTESWNGARLVFRKDKSMVTWTHSWSLPSLDGQRYKIMARAIDAGGNIETAPAVTFVQMAMK